MTDIDEVKRRLSVVDVVGEYVKLQKSGASFRGRCPFHSEKTPSFFVSPEKDIWHCFGSCQKGGDIFRFLMEIESIEFSQALRILAQRAGVQLQGFDQKKQDKKSNIVAINELARTFFQKALEKSQGGKKAKAYLLKRGVSEESIDRFGLGWAPSSWRALLSFLDEKGYERDDAVDAGLAVKGESGSVYDRFRARIMFPVASSTGQIAGFTGRVLQEDEKTPKPSSAEGFGGAKYVNTPQTLLYDKSRELYGLYQAKQAIKQQDDVLFVEGNMDVILSSQAGIENVVATSGTALTPQHLDLVGRYTKNITFCFDADSAGENAAKRAFEIALKKSFTIQALALHETKDPAELVLEKGAKVWQEAYTKRMHIMEFVWTKAKTAYDLDSLKGKKAVANEFFALLLLMPNQMEKGHWIKQLADRISLREEDILEEFRKFETFDKGASEEYNTRAPAPLIKQNRIEQDRQNIVAIVKRYPKLGKGIKGIDVATLEDEIDISAEELSLKAEAYWPSESLAKRELERIVEHLRFIKRKNEVLSVKGSRF